MAEPAQTKHFESGSLDTNYWSGETGRFSVDGPSAKNGDYGLLSSTTENNGGSVIYHNHSSQQRPSKIQVWMWSSDEASDISFIQSGTEMIEIGFNVYGDYLRVNGNNAFSPSYDTWYLVELENIDYASGTIGSFKVDGTEYFTNISFKNSVTGGFDKTEVRHWGGDVFDVGFRFDDLTVGEAVAGLTTNSASSIAAKSVQLNANLDSINSDLSSVDVYFQYRKQGNTSWNETTKNSKSSTGSFSETAPGLEPGTTYQFRAAATDGSSPNYASISTFTTDKVVSTNSATGVSLSGATLNGQLNDLLGNSSVDIYFEYTPQYSEGFESGFGDWINGGEIENSANTWTRNSGSTPSSNTGPGSAVEGSYYIYVEASDGDGAFEAGKETIIEYQFEGSRAGNIDFQYHMYGGGQGSLYLEGYDGSSWNRVWAVGGGQGNQWNQVSESFSNYQALRFRNESSYGYEGDVALDDIVIATSNTQTTTAQSKSSTGSFSESITGLEHSAVHDFRAVMDTGSNVYYGDYLTFNTSSAVSTAGSSSVSDSQADLSGSVDSLDGNSSVDFYIEYRSENESSWTSTPASNVSSTGSYTDTITGLDENTKYEYRAVNDTGSTLYYGEIETFSTTKLTGDVVEASNSGVRLTTSSGTSKSE